MSRKYLPVTGEKPMFLPLDMQSWVPKDHFAWFLVDVVQQLDTSALQAGTSPRPGRAGGGPAREGTRLPPCPRPVPLRIEWWVPRAHFAWFLVDVVQQLDPSALQAGTSPGRGRPGYDPQMLATLVMYAMSCGERSSREIEDRTRTDAGFRVASGN